MILFMARKVQNDKGFLIIEMTPDEAMNNCKFGVSINLNDIKYHDLICDNCNKCLNQDDYIYYIAVLNMVFCKECYDEWYEHAVHYVDDNEYEKACYDEIVELLNLKIDETN